jgi:hypothetical protein
MMDKAGGGNNFIPWSITSGNWLASFRGMSFSI